MKNNLSYGKHIVQYSSSYSLCANCSSCEIVCALVHDGVSSPSCNRLVVSHGDTLSMIAHVLTCQQCDDHPCYEACPRKERAMCLDENGIVYINEEQCIGCGKCVSACNFEPSRINMAKGATRKEWKAKKCDLCRTRPEGPACVQYCPVRCLGVDTVSVEDVKDPISEDLTMQGGNF